MMMARNMYNSSEKDILLFVHLCTQNRNTRIDKNTEREKEKEREMLFANRLFNNERCYLSLARKIFLSL
jgi:hypothetical protein